MKATCLTVMQPYAEYIIRHGKDVENRPRHFNYRGWLAIHAGQSLKWFPKLADGFFRDCYGHPRRISSMPRGAIIGFVEVYDCRRYTEYMKHNQWASGPWCMMLRNAVSLSTPFPCPGKQGLWYVDLPDTLVPKCVLEGSKA